MLDYNSIKALAKSAGRSVTELVALAVDNDPFYVSPARQTWAKWFADMLGAYGGGVRVHLRRLHYRMVSPPPGVRILLPDGSEYQNTENHWKYLIKASLGARYLGLLPDDALEDKRNAPPTLLAKPTRRNGKAACYVVRTSSTHVDIPDMPMLPFYGVTGFDAGQDCILEVWIEKSTQDDWLMPLCRRRGVNLVVGIGDQSETRARELAFRAHEADAPVRVIYISDFDPNGRNMPKGLARKVEFNAAKYGLRIDVQIIPLMLTPEQCRHYKLPRTPIKDSNKGRSNFEEAFGEGATELDALEALHPGEMARLLEAAIDKFYDPTLARRVSAAEWDQRRALDLIERDIKGQHAQEIAAIEADFAEITSRYNDWKERASGLYETIARELRDRTPDLSDVEIPRSEAPGKTDSTVLYDSKRTYFEQMDHYNAWKDGEATDD